ncbi:MAG: hypothetical protein ABF242_05500 [Flavobacteriales bacterium]
MKLIYFISFITLLLVSCSNPLVLPGTELEELNLKGSVFKLVTIENEFDTTIETFNENGHLLRQIIRDSNGLFSDWQNYYNKSGIKYKTILNHGRFNEDSVYFKYNKNGDFEEVINFQGKDTAKSEWRYDEKGDLSVLIMYINNEPKSRWDYEITDSTIKIEMYVYEIETSRSVFKRFNKLKQVVKVWDDQNKLTSYQYLEGTDFIKAISQEVNFNGVKEINTNYFYELDKDSNWVSETEIINTVYYENDSTSTEMNNTTRIIEYY